jgi:hypothetical protein
VDNNDLYEEGDRKTQQDIPDRILTGCNGWNHGRCIGLVTVVNLLFAKELKVYLLISERDESDYNIIKFFLLMMQARLPGISILF